MSPNPTPRSSNLTRAHCSAESVCPTTAYTSPRSSSRWSRQKPIRKMKTKSRLPVLTRQTRHSPECKDSPACSDFAGSLAPPEGLIQSVVDRRRSNPEPRRSPAIDDQRNRETTGLLVGRNVFQLGQTLELRYKSIRPVVELIGIRIFEGVLILRAAYAVVDRDVLHRLHIERNSLHVLQILLQPAHQIGRADIPVFQRLQVDRHTPTDERCIGPVGSDERRNTLDRRILEDHFG